MIIAACGDIHSPRYLGLFKESVKRVPEPDVFFLLGDIVMKNRVEEYRNVLDLLKRFDCLKIGVFGNEEYVQDEERYLKLYGDEVIFLRDESRVFRINDVEVGVVGTRGALDNPTFWQRKNLPGIEAVYRERVLRVRKLLLNLKCQLKIFLTHYAPTYKVLRGEKNPKYFPQMGSRKFERVIIEGKPNLVFTAHSHKGSSTVYVDNIPVHNVSLPLNRRICIISTLF